MCVCVCVRLQMQVEMEVLLGGEAAGLVSLLQREQLSVTALNRLDQLTTRVTDLSVCLSAGLSVSVWV